MNTLRPLLKIVLTVLCVLVGAGDLYAQKRIGVIMTGDVGYYEAMHESFVKEVNSRLAGKEKIEIILQKPFPNPISWSNAARKLIAFDVDIIVTYGAPATQAVIHEKSRIPHVYAGLYEPEQAGVSGKYVTGCGFKVPLSSIIRYFKRLKPIETLGVVYSSIEEDSVRQFNTMKELADQQNIKVARIDIRSQADLAQLQSKKADAVFITGSSLVHLWIDDVLTMLRSQQVPAADIFPDDDEDGVLMALFQPPFLQGQLAGEMAAKILRGADPTDMAPYTFRDTELVFNLVEARHLGIDFPIHLLIEATRVIE